MADESQRPSEVKKRFSPRINKKLALSTACLVVIVGGLYGAYELGTNKTDSGSGGSVTSYVDAQTDIQKLQTQVGTLVFKKEKQPASDRVNEQPESFKNTSEVQQILAGIYMNKQDWSGALEVYKSIEQKYGLSSSTASGAAAAAEKIKDYETALHYYELAKAKAQADTKNPSSITEIRFYDTKLQELAPYVSDSAN